MRSSVLRRQMRHVITYLSAGHFWKLPATNAWPPKGSSKLTSKRHDPYRVLSVEPECLKILQDGVETFVSINRVTRITQEGDASNHPPSKTVKPEKQAFSLQRNYKTKNKWNNTLSNQFPPISRKGKGHTTLYDGIATAARTTPSKYRDLFQSISWMITGAGSNDSPPRLYREETTEPALKGRGQQSRITDASRYE